MLIAVFSLDSLASLCKAISFDFYLKPHSKILYHLKNSVFFFSEISLRLPQPLSIAFNLEQNHSRFLVCSEKKSFLTNDLPTKTLFHVPIIRIKDEILVNLEWNPDTIQKWSSIIDNTTDIDSLIDYLSNKALILMNTRGDYGFILLRNSLFITKKELLQQIISSSRFPNDLTIYVTNLTFAKTKFE